MKVFKNGLRWINVQSMKRAIAGMLGRPSEPREDQKRPDVPDKDEPYHGGNTHRNDSPRMRRHRAHRKIRSRIARESRRVNRKRSA